MNRALLAALLVAGPAAAAPALPKPLVAGLKNPESAAVGADGRVYVSVIGEFDKDGDGSVVVVKDGKAVPFAEGLDDPKGLVAFQQSLFVADKTRVWKIDAKGKARVFAAAEAFPQKPQFLNDIVADERGTLYVSDSGDLKGGGGAIFRIDPRGKVTLVANAAKVPELGFTNGLLMDSLLHLLFVNMHTGELYRLSLTDGTAEKLADGFGGADGLCWDRHGRLYVSDYKNGKLFVIPRPGRKPVLLAEGFENAADICLDAAGTNILVPDMKAGTVTAIPASVPGEEVDETPLDLAPRLAFPDLEWTDWKKEDAAGKAIPLRPLVLTHAGDGSNRVFVATEQGVIHAFANDPKATKTKVFLDIQDRVFYDDKENEQGLLGLAFHPNYKKNGEFFVFYTLKKPKLTNVVSRFRVSKDDPDKADPASEEEILRITHRFWNHDGGTLCFDQYGKLFIAVGDGGDMNDPDDNGQNLGNWLGKVLRIDVDNKPEGAKYGVPRDNPFYGRKDAKGEIWCYGLRNPWRIAFDRKGGELWCADVGQNLWEEIDILREGGNHGWSRREGLNPFGPKGTGPRKEFADPIWVYDHAVGKSITGGFVYRGKQFPELEGHYLYADYVSNKTWALKYDRAKNRVTANRPIPDAGVPIMSWGEDEAGEAYFMTYNATGKAVYRLAQGETK